MDKGKEAGTGTVVALTAAQVLNLLSGGVAKADEIIVTHAVLDGAVYATQIRLKYDALASEGKDAFDGILPFSGDIQGYSGIDGVKHNLIAKPIDSLTDTIFTYETNKNDVGGDEYWLFSITSLNGASNSKNIFYSRYGKDANLADPNIVALKTWDVKYMSDADWVQHGSFAKQSPGKYDETRFEPYNQLDLNRNKTVGIEDWRILVNNLGRTGVIKGSNPNDPNDYADINNTYVAGDLISYGDGNVDMTDVGLFRDQHRIPDFNLDGLVNLTDFAIFADYWQTSGHGAHDNWAEGTDIDRDGNVDEIDLGEFARQWMCNSDVITKAMQTLSQEYRQGIDKAATYILNHIGDTKLTYRVSSNNIPGLSPDILAKNNSERQLVVCHI